MRIFAPAYNSDNGSSSQPCADHHRWSSRVSLFRFRGHPRTVVVCWWPHHCTCIHCTPQFQWSLLDITNVCRDPNFKSHTYLYFFDTPLRNAKAPGWTAILVNSSAAFLASLYIIAKTKKRGARGRQQQQQIPLSLPPSAQLTQVRFPRGNTWKMYGRRGL